MVTLPDGRPSPSDVFTSVAVSSGVNCRSAARNSVSCSVARSRAIGSGGSGARRDGKLDARRGALDQAHDRLVAFVGVDDVVVVEDEHHAGRGRLQLGEERGCGIGFAGERPEPIRSLLTAGRQPERRTDVRPEHGRVVVLPIDRDPGKGAGIDVRPVGQQRGLAEPGRRNHQESARGGRRRASASVAPDGRFRRAGPADAASSPEGRAPGRPPVRFRGSCRHATPTSRARGPQIQPDDGR